MDQQLSNDLTSSSIAHNTALADRPEALSPTSTPARAFYRSLQQDIQDLYKKVDRDLDQMTSNLQDRTGLFTFKGNDATVFARRAVSDMKNAELRPRSPGKLREDASPRNRGPSQRNSPLRSVVSSQSSRASSTNHLQAVLSHDITEPTNNLTRNVMKSRRTRPLMDTTSSCTSTESQSVTASSSVSELATMMAAPTGSSISHRALASPTWIRDATGKLNRTDSTVWSQRSTTLSPWSEQNESLQYSVSGSEKVEVILGQIQEGDGEDDDTDDTDDTDEHQQNEKLTGTVIETTTTTTATTKEEYLITANVRHESRFYGSNQGIEHADRVTSRDRPNWSDGAGAVSGSGIVGLIRSDASNKLNIEETLDFSHASRIRRTNDDGHDSEKSPLLQLLSTDSSAVVSPQADEQKNNESLAIKGRARNREGSLSSSQSRSSPTEFEKDVMEKGKATRNTQRRFFPDDESVDSKEGSMLEIIHGRKEVGSSKPMELLGKSHSSVSELTPFTSEASETRSNSPNQQMRTKDKLPSYQSLRSKVIRSQRFDSIHLGEKKKLSSSNRPDAPDWRSSAVFRQDSSDAEGRRLDSPAACSDVALQPATNRTIGTPIEKSGGEGGQNEDAKLVTALVVKEPVDPTVSRCSWTLDSLSTEPELRGDIVLYPVEAAPSALTDFSSSHDKSTASRSEFVGPAGTRRQRRPEEEKKDDDKALIPRREDNILLLKQVGSKKIKDPYGDIGIYTGLLQNGLPHGQGTMLYGDGRIYSGEWTHGRWNGFGKTTFSNGDTYVGQYNIDKRHGVGRYEWADGRIYDGEFLNDQREGKGTYSFPDGSVYTGGFRAGLRHGRGCYRFADSSVYDGEFKDGKYHGIGECVWSDGRCYRGEWHEGRAHGFGIEMRPDGSIRHQGEWNQDRPVRQSDDSKESSKRDRKINTTERKVAKDRSTKLVEAKVGGPEERRPKTPPLPIVAKTGDANKSASKYAFGSEPQWAKKIRAKKEAAKTLSVQGKKGEEQQCSPKRERQVIRRAILRD